MAETSRTWTGTTAIEKLMPDSSSTVNFTLQGVVRGKGVKMKLGPESWKLVLNIEILRFRKRKKILLVWPSRVTFRCKNVSKSDLHTLELVILEKSICDHKNENTGSDYKNHVRIWTLVGVVKWTLDTRLVFKNSSSSLTRKLLTRKICESYSNDYTFITFHRVFMCYRILLEYQPVSYEEIIIT